MPGISFTIQNPDSIPEANQPVIYTDKLDKSQLIFSFTQNVGISSVGPNDRFRIHFPQAALSTASPEMLASTDWKVVDFQNPTTGNPNYTFLLQPVQEISFLDNTLKIAFKGLAGQEQTMADVSVSYLIQGAPVPATNQSTKLHITAYPDKAVVLSDNILFPSIHINVDQEGFNDDCLYLSAAGLRPPIANQISLNLKFSGSQLVEEWDSSSLPFFEISFSYGQGINDLTDAIPQGDPGYNPLTTAFNIVAEVGENDLWEVQKASSTEQWKITPTAANTHLFTANNNNLDITFSHVISQLPEGNATIYIQWGNIPGYIPSWKARNIIKQEAKAKVISFNAPNGDKTARVSFGQGVEFDWTVFAAPMVQLRCPEDPSLDDEFPLPGPNTAPALYYCGGLRPGRKKTGDTCTNLTTRAIIPVYPENTFYLRPIDLDGQEMGKEVEPIVVTVSDYPAPSLKKKPSAAGAIFNVSENGTPIYYYHQLGANVKLDWELEDPRVVHSITITRPDGKPIHTIKDPTHKTAKATISMASEGTYTVKFISRERGLDISQKIILRSLSKKMIDTTFLSDSLVAVNEKYPMAAIAFGEKVTFNGAVYGETPVLYHFHLQLHFKKDGTGIIALLPTKFSLNYADKDWPSTSPPIKLHPTTQPPVLATPKPLQARTFTWQVAPGNSGNLLLNYAGSRATWTIQLKGGSNPDHLRYFSNASTDVPWIKDWSIVSPLLRTGPGMLDVTVNGRTAQAGLLPLPLQTPTYSLGAFQPENNKKTDYYFKKQ